MALGRNHKIFNIGNASGTIQGLTRVYHDLSLSGDGTLSSLLGVVGDKADEEVNQYVYDNSATIDNVNTSYQTNSGTFLTAIPDYYATTGDINDLAQSISETYQVKGDYVERNAMDSAIEFATSGKLNASSFASVSSDFLVASSLNGYATESFVEETSGAITSLIPTNYYPDTNPSSFVNEDWVTEQGYITGVDLSEYAKRDFVLSSIESATSSKLDVSSFASVSGDFLVAESLNGYATEQWVGEQGYLTEVSIPESADWSEATTTVQTNSSNWDNVTNKLDTTSFSDVSSTFLTAVDLTPYQTIEGMTAYQPAGSYATTNELEQVSGDITALIPSTAGLASESYVQTNSAVLTGMIDGKQDTLTFGYDEQDRINSINSSALAGGGDVPEDVMVETNLEYNAVNEISGYNGSAIAQYGAEKQWLVHDDTLVHAANSAQYALGVNLSAVAQLLGVDETVLANNIPNVSTAITLSEKPTNFNKLQIYSNYGAITDVIPNDSYLTWSVNWIKDSQIFNRTYSMSSTNGTNWTVLKVIGYGASDIGSTATFVGGTSWYLETIKIIGIGRKEV